jgi:hypothetical protein
LRDTTVLVGEGEKKPFCGGTKSEEDCGIEDCQIREEMRGGVIDVREDDGDRL